MKYLNKYTVVVIFSLIIVSMLFFTIYTPIEENCNKKIGFFSPNYLDSFVSQVNFSMINLYPVHDKKKGSLRINLDSVKKIFDYVGNYNHRVHLNLGSVITDLKEPEAMNTYYENDQGTKLTKVFNIASSHKIRKIVSHEEIELRLSGLPEMLKIYYGKVGTIFIADEPFLNGISNNEINRAVRTIRKFFKKNGVDGLKFGTIFAAGLFDSDFATHINRQMMKYVENIDKYYKEHKSLLSQTGIKAQGFKKWIDIMNNSRLTTYDSANNFYTEGGIPTELDVVSFDSYLSTMLFDRIHEHTLHYFSVSLGCESCRQFENITLSELRKKLSFIQDGPMNLKKDNYENDKALLDAIFECRMAGNRILLERALQALPKQPRLMLIGESSANGVLEFDSEGRIEPEQPWPLVEKCILDEVKRSYQYYIESCGWFNEGLMYFLYPDSLDVSINQFIRGAEGAKSVTSFIYSHVNMKEKPLAQPHNAL